MVCETLDIEGTEIEAFQWQTAVLSYQQPSHLRAGKCLTLSPTQQLQRPMGDGPLLGLGRARQLTRLCFATASKSCRHRDMMEQRSRNAMPHATSRLLQP